MKTKLKDKKYIISIVSSGSPQQNQERSRSEKRAISCICSRDLEACAVQTVQSRPQALGAAHHASARLDVTIQDRAQVSQRRRAEGCASNVRRGTEGCASVTARRTWAVSWGCLFGGLARLSSLLRIRHARSRTRTSRVWRTSSARCARPSPCPPAASPPGQPRPKLAPPRGRARRTRARRTLAC